MQGTGSVTTGDNAFHVGPFGSFDIQIDLGQGNNGLDAGQSGTWEIDLGGTGFDLSNFNTLSASPPASQLSVASLKFTQGQGDDSAFVTPVPEPGSLLLLGSGILGLAGWRRQLK